MKISRMLIGAGVAVAAASLSTVGIATASTPSATPSVAGKHALHACGAPAKGYAACFAQSMVSDNGAKPNAASPSGLNPADIQSAYKLSGSSTATVAIVDAYDDPNAEADLGVYRSQFGLPACTTANGCFKKVNQTGGTKYPRVNASWAVEISLDLDMVTAACPTCHILLVEASSNSFANLAAAVNYAASVPGVVAISNSYGGSDSAETSSYNHPGIAITASSGDSGYGAQSPASYPHVIGVGGTSLTRASNTRGWNETAWSGAGSGCSTLNAKPSWQTSVTQCSGKAISDVSAVADPNTGVSVYDSTSYQGIVGWSVWGGTSAASPIIAAVYALGGNTAGYPASYTWSHASGLFDVTSGSNGTCSPSIWCHAVAGWDGPTGLGTPNGTSAF
ncbi:S53 family peptidase [Jatrophihabitans sp.]|uniref:S53 family peptidase n=1 Tax=Jatrophihabitans sp. TaxID=1932789 RepID=UPI002C0713AD|nr:S53 family peptidase [Jatrophihabitans sp.]